LSHSELGRLRIIRGQALVNGNWESFSVLVRHWVAFNLASDIPDAALRATAANVLDVSPDSLLLGEADKELSYRTLDKKVQAFLEKPRDKSQQPIKVRGHLKRGDFKLEKISRVKHP